LIRTTSRRIQASAGTNQGPEKGDLVLQEHAVAALRHGNEPLLREQLSGISEAVDELDRLNHAVTDILSANRHPILSYPPTDILSNPIR